MTVELYTALLASCLPFLLPVFGRIVEHFLPDPDHSQPLPTSLPPLALPKAVARHE